MCSVEKWQLALLFDIKKYLNTCYWNKEQREMRSPFDNTGETFQTNHLTLIAYQWDDEDDEEDKYNLKFKDVEISWYKYLGRGTTINKELSMEEWVVLYNEIIDEIRTFFGKYAPDGREI